MFNPFGARAASTGRGFRVTTEGWSYIHTHATLIQDACWCLLHQPLAVLLPPAGCSAIGQTCTAENPTSCCSGACFDQNTGAGPRCEWPRMASHTHVRQLRQASMVVLQSSINAHHISWQPAAPPSHPNASRMSCSAFFALRDDHKFTAPTGVYLTKYGGAWKGCKVSWQGPPGTWVLAWTYTLCRDVPCCLDQVVNPTGSRARQTRKPHVAGGHAAAQAFVSAAPPLPRACSNTQNGVGLTSSTGLFCSPFPHMVCTSKHPAPASSSQLCLSCPQVRRFVRKFCKVLGWWVTPAVQVVLLGSHFAGQFRS